MLLLDTTSTLELHYTCCLDTTHDCVIDSQLTCRRHINNYRRGLLPTEMESTNTSPLNIKRLISNLKLTSYPAVPLVIPILDEAVLACAKPASGPTFAL